MPDADGRETGRGAEMVTVVYIDVLFAVNLILNYFILLATSAVLHRKDKRLRMLLGAALGAVYALFIFFPQVNFLYSSLMKLVFSVTIVAVAFRFSTLRNLLRLVIVFYVISFLFGGVAFALYLFVSPPGMLMRNGVVYLDISPLILILSAAGCYILITLTSRFYNRSKKAGESYDIAIEADGKSASMTGFLDTGNRLTDTITGVPVIVTEYQPIEGLLPKELRRLFKTGVADNPAALSSCAWAGRFRMVPYGSVGATGGLLPAFRPDRLTVTGKDTRLVTGDVLIAVSGRKICDDGKHAALLNPGLFEAHKLTV